MSNRILSQLNEEEITTLIISKYPETVTQYLPGHYVSKNYLEQDLHEYRLCGNWREEIQGWVSDVMINTLLPDYVLGTDDANDELSAIADMVGESMFNKYYNKEASYEELLDEVMFV